MNRRFLTPHSSAFVIILFLGLMLFFRSSTSFVSEGAIPGDFQVYHRAAIRVQNGVMPYIPTESSPYKYSPGALVFQTFLPAQPIHAWMIFKASCIGFLMASLWVGIFFTRWREVLLLLVGFALSWKGLTETLDYGQLEFLILFAAVISARLFQKQPLISGFLIGLMPWFKLPWGFVAVPFLFACLRSFRQPHTWKFLAGISGGFISLGALIPVLFFGYEKAVSLTLAWIDLLKTQPLELYTNDLNQSIWSTGARMMKVHPTFGILVLSCLGLVCALFFLHLSLRGLKGLNFSPALAAVTPWLILMQLINPLSWRWGSMLLLGAPLAAQFGLQFQSLKSKLLFLAIVFLWIIQLNPVARALGFQHWTQVNHFGSVTWYWIFILAFCLETIKKNPCHS